MSYEDIKKTERAWAAEVANDLNNSSDKYIVYRESRPITDIKNMLQTSVELYADNVAFMQKFAKDEPYKSITYRETVNSLGTGLISKGLKGKRIAVIGENCYQWATSYLAVICGTGIVVPLDKELSANELKQLVIEAEVSAVMFTEKYAQIFKEMKESKDTKIDLLVKLNGDKEIDGMISWSELAAEGKKLMQDGDTSFTDAEIINDEMSELLFTSGTTGIAKGVMLSHKNICFDLMIAPTILKVNTWDIFFSVLPIHHTYEGTCGFLMPLYKGAAIAYCEGLKYIVKNLSEVRPTMFLGVPALFETLYKTIMKNVRKQGKEKLVRKVMAVNKVTKKVGIDLNKKLLKDILKVFGGRMRVLISGGAAIDPAILQFFNDLGFIAVQGYGLSECAPMGALNPDQHKYMRNASVGHILPGMDVKIEDKDEDGIGEICLKGDNVMLGYYKNAEATAQIIDKDGWLHTGDLATIDEQGYVTIRGRSKNLLLNSSGQNIYPEEIESKLNNMPYVAESLIVLQNDKLVALIYPDFDDAFAHGLQQPDIEKAMEANRLELNLQLPAFSQISKVKIHFEEFEKTAKKSIKRFMYQEAKG